MYHHERSTLTELLNLDSYIERGNFDDLADYVKLKLGIKNLIYFSPSVTGNSYLNPFYQTTYNSEWEQRYRDQSYIYIDPVFQKGINSIVPVDWSMIPRHDKITEQFFFEAEEFGVGNQGITIPVRFPNATVSALFTVTADVPKKEWKEFRGKIIKDTIVLASYFHARVHEQLARAYRPTFNITKREKEVISWAAEGKTIEDIATILSIKRETAKAHLDSIRHKTNATNTTHAVSILHRNGLIS
jgi:DNA-binding CsgD family transcriptional regulator